MNVENKLKSYQIKLGLLELVQIAFNKFEIRINSKVKVVEYDYDRVIAQFENYKNYYV